MFIDKGIVLQWPDHLLCQWQGLPVNDCKFYLAFIWKTSVTVYWEVLKFPIYIHTYFYKFLLKSLLSLKTMTCCIHQWIFLFVFLTKITQNLNWSLNYLNRHMRFQFTPDKIWKRFKFVYTFKFYYCLVLKYIIVEKTGDSQK